MAWKHRGWLGCPRWDGQEKTLPLGMTTQVPGLSARHFANLYGVVDSAEEDGIREVFRDLLEPGDVIVTAYINEEAVEAIEASYGDKWCLFTAPDSGKKLTREGWRDEYRTDPLVLEALKDMRAYLGQKGVKKT